MACRSARSSHLADRGLHQASAHGEDGREECVECVEDLEEDEQGQPDTEAGSRDLFFLFLFRGRPCPGRRGSRAFRSVRERHSGNWRGCNGETRRDETISGHTPHQ